MIQRSFELCWGRVSRAYNHPFCVYICCKKFLCYKYMWICNFGRDVPRRRRSSGSVESMNIRPNVQMFGRTFTKHSAECSVQSDVPPACLKSIFHNRHSAECPLSGRMSVPKKSENVHFNPERFESFKVVRFTLSRVDRSIGKISLLFMPKSHRFVC